MALYEQAHRSKDGLLYAYFWVRILTEESGKAFAGKVLANQTDQIDSSVLILGIAHARETFANLRKVAPAPSAPLVAISHHAFQDTYDRSRHSVSVQEMPAGTDLVTAKGWISSAEGVAWAGAGFCFLAHTAILVEA